MSYLKTSVVWIDKNTIDYGATVEAFKARLDDYCRNVEEECNVLTLNKEVEVGESCPSGECSSVVSEVRTSKTSDGCIVDGWCEECGAWYCFYEY